MEKTFIYVLIDPRNNLPKYIGKSNNPSKRFTNHCREQYKSLKRNWIVSLKKLELKPVLEILDEVPSHEWEFWEKHYISLYKSWGFNLLNDTHGGYGVGTHTKQTKDKISKSMIGNTFAKGIKRSDEFKNKLSLAHGGKPWSNARRLAQDLKQSKIE